MGWHIVTHTHRAKGGSCRIRFLIDLESTKVFVIAIIIVIWCVIFRYRQSPFVLVVVTILLREKIQYSFVVE